MYQNRAAGPTVRPAVSAGTFYGSTGNAYPSQGQNYGGTVFQVASGTLSTIGNIPGPVEQVSGPHSGLVMDSQGNLYGETMTGGTNNYGTVFELPYSNGSWGSLMTLHNFAGTDGAYPVGGLLLDSGNLYGTTYSGVIDGSGCSTQLVSSTYPLGCGVVSEITP